jgi:uncharacterized cofD-like protein
MSDDGGSTGVLRDELGVLPPGDVRQCLVALSDNPDVRDLFSYRFADGRFEGQSLGNIILSGLELRHGSFEKAVQVASDILHITGHVVPVTTDKHTLVVRDGARVYRGEHIIDGPLELGSGALVWLEPAAQLNPAAAQAIAQADMVVLAPGSLHTSLLPILAVDGMAEALATTSALVVSVANLVNKPKQTDDWHVVDYVRQFARYVGNDTVDVVLYNDEPIADLLLQRYAADGEFPVHTEAGRFQETSTKAVGARLVSREIVGRQAPGDQISRTLIRHDAAAVCDELRKLLKSTN